MKRIERDLHVWGLLGVLAFAGVTPGLNAAGLPQPSEAAYYHLETIPVPTNIVLEVGGMAFMPDGRLMICTRYGEIWSLHHGKWKEFASGLNEPMGLWPTGPNQVAVAQRPELTLITDVNGDGVADRFQTLADNWNYTGHRYEWTFGPVEDRAGNLWCTLSCWFFPIQHYAKSPYSGWELPAPAGYVPRPPAKWRGWCFKVTPDGKFVPWASGLRSPNGLGFNLQGDLFVADNQGEYLGACQLYHIVKGAFYGHPLALFWGPHKVKDPFAIPLKTLQKERKLPAVIFPYGVMGQSASQPLCDTTKGGFGPFKGQLFIGDQTRAFLMRVALEKVNGEYQGACFPFRSGFQCGINRLAFGPEGHLWVGETDRGWGSTGSRRYGLERLDWTGKMPMEILKWNVRPNGFALWFTKPVDRKIAGDVTHYSLRHFDYLYHRTYGSPEEDVTPQAIQSVQLSHHGRCVSLAVENLVPKTIYELDISGLRASDGTPLLHTNSYYTLNVLPSDKLYSRSHE